MSAVSLDLEVVELLRDSPELLAIADAIAATQTAEPRHRSRRVARWAGLVAAVAAVLAVALVDPWLGTTPGFAARALAALGEGQVIRVVSRARVPGASVIDVRFGSARPVTFQTEILFDGSRHLERIRSMAGGAVVTDVLETPQGSWTSTGPVYTCAWIAAHPLQATRLRVSCNISGVNGTKPRTLPEPVPALDPALAGFVTGYRAALKEKRAQQVGAGTVDGRHVEWLRFVFVDHGPPGTHPTRRVERVAVDAATLKPVQLETVAGGQRQTVTIAAVDTLGRQPGQFTRPALIPVKQRPVITNVKSQRQVSLDQASAALRGRLVWSGLVVSGLALESVKTQTIVTGYGVFSGVRPTHATGVELVYGSPKRMTGAPYIRLQEAVEPLMLYGFFTGRVPPREGTMRVETIGGGAARGGKVIRRWTIWRGLLVKNGRYIQLETTSRQLLLATARALETR